VVWEREAYLGSGVWVSYHDKDSEAIENHLLEEGEGAQVVVDIDNHPADKAHHNHQAMVDPHRRLHINMDTGANLRCRRRKKYANYETVPHNEEVLTKDFHDDSVPRQRSSSNSPP